MPSMRRVTAIGCFLAIFFLGGTLAGAQTRPATEAEVRRSYHLVTVGQGDEVWEKYGHNMIRIVDARGSDVLQDVSINWGIFDFNKPNFIGNFIRGRMIYTVAAIPSRDLFEEYLGNDRKVRVQALQLSPGQAARLEERLDRNLLPANRDYRYDYFYDNCSTRVRDSVDDALGGQLKTQAEAVRVSETFRSHALRLTADDFWVSSGQDFLLGRLTDHPLTAWEEMFLPEKVADFVATMQVTDETSAVPRAVVTRTGTSAVKSRPPERKTAPARWAVLMLIGVVLAGVPVTLALGGTWARRGALLILIGWSLVAGLAGVMLAFLWGFTDHAAAHRNENLILYSPLSLLMAGALPLVGRADVLRFARRLSALLLGLTGLALSVKLLPGSAQQNWGWLTLATLLHGAVFWVLRRCRVKSG